MTKDKLIEAFKEAIKADRNMFRKHDRITVITENGNPVYIENRTPETGGLYLEGLQKRALIGIEDIESHELTESEYNTLVEFYDQHDKV